VGISKICLNPSQSTPTAVQFENIINRYSLKFFVHRTLHQTILFKKSCIKESNIIFMSALKPTPTWASHYKAWD